MLLGDIIPIRRVILCNFIDFLLILTKGRGGLLLKIVDWIFNEHTWIFSERFLNGQRSDNPLTPNYVPSVFKHADSTRKRKLVKDMDNFVRRQVMKTTATRISG